jgi:myo-inositol-1(or 4)-monophosphatase
VPPGPSSDEWIAALRGAVASQKRVFAEHAGIDERTRYEGVGEGGDHTLVIDRLCEDAVFAELELLHEAGHEFTAVSEERGTVTFGSGESSLLVIIDPIDGSLNARRTVPLHSLSVAVADGGSMADVKLAYVYEFGAREEFFATAGEGASLDGRALHLDAEDGLELVAVEASKPERMISVCRVLDGLAYRVRTPGSIAVSLAYSAAGRFDGMLTTRPCRSVDAAAAQLLVTEAGGFLAFGDDEPAAVSLELSARFHVAAARTAADLATLLEAQEAVQ